MKRIYGGATIPKSKLATTPVIVRKKLPPIPKRQPKETIKIELSDDTEDIQSLIITDDNDDEWELTAELGELPYCCGMLELGNFEVTGYRAVSTLTKNKAFKQFFEELFDLKVVSSKTMIINTIEDGNCRDIAAYLKTSPFFTRVKEFKNPNTNRIINVWISNK